MNLISHSKSSIINDFESELNVNILGHIFEQSISVIENFKAELLGGRSDNNISRRKQEGIFYTPDFITKYLIEDVVGRFLEENPDKLENIKILDPACGSGADTLNIWFRDKQATAKNINESIEQLNKEINTHVYNLYILNDTEIKLIERENSNY
jgi:type I restriction-modification system DNA methylase subunit